MKAGLVAIGAILILAAGVVGVTAYLERPSDSRLIGTWQSDADATIAERDADLRAILGSFRASAEPAAAAPKEPTPSRRKAIEGGARPFQRS